MEDCCAVCAETLEWIAYGSCGHRELCSTCVIRLRFILGDRHCCICKTDCPTIFVTKALGNFTEAKSEFSEFPPGVSEGQHGKYWYHEDSQAYFNDVDHYRMIRAMCRLSCSICDNNAADQRRDGNRRNKFRNIEQLKGHLYHQHKMFMCSLCLESRKVFISEQKLYNRSQLRQHINSGDSEADGNESERGGFTGHPICEFCRNPFYGDTELYMHMSTEHYTCHICQRQHPGQYDYYRNYDDLEAHFRQEHFLCEHEACLTKKFVVFQSEAEMKRHNTIEHSGLSRSKRNAALQIPVSFRYRRSAVEDQQRGRRRGFHPQPSQLTIQSSSEMAVADRSLHESSSGSGGIHSDRGETNQSDMITSTMESLAISSHPEELSSMSDAYNSQSFGSAPAVEEISFPPLSNFEPPEPSSRYAQVLNQGISARLVEASFPPLPGAKDSNKPMIAPVSEGLAANTIAARLKLRSKVLHSARPKASQDYELDYSISGSSLEMRPQTRSQSPATSNSNFIAGITANEVFPPVSSASPQVPTLKGNGFATSIPISSVWNSHSLNRARHSASAPKLSINGPPNNPPSSIISSVTLNGGLSRSNQSSQHVQNVQIANKSLVESIRSGLGMDEEKYAAFKTISTEYRQDRIDTWEYLSYVEQFGLSHLVLELARLCPDSKKQQELIDAYNANVCHIGVLEENNSGGSSKTHKVGKRRKGKGKAVETAAKDALADNNLDNGRELQTSDHSFKEVEVLSKDGYYTAKDQLSSTREHNATGTIIVDDSSSQRKTITDNSGDECGRKNHKLKFHRLPLGEGNADRNPRTISGEHRTDDSDRVPIRGVWHNGGGHRLFSQSHASK